MFVVELPVVFRERNDHNLRLVASGDNQSFIRSFHLIAVVFESFPNLGRRRRIKGKQGNIASSTKYVRYRVLYTVHIAIVQETQIGFGSLRKRIPNLRDRSVSVRGRHACRYGREPVGALHRGVGVSAEGAFHL